MTKQIKIRIYPDGRIESETEGIKGKSCTDYIKTIEGITKAKTVDSSYTEEYYETEQSASIEEKGYQFDGN